jgi:hypothetical protein
MTKIIKDTERELNILEALQESLNYTDQNSENNILWILAENNALDISFNITYYHECFQI